MDDITTDKGLEAMIHEAQKRTCSISEIQLKEHEYENSVVIDYLGFSAKNRLLAYGLIEKGKVRGCYPLTIKGQQFKTFKDEDEKSKLLDKKLRLDVSNAERVYKTYFTTRFITWVSFLIALFLLFLRLAEALNIWPFHK